jgi:hypothetical protein
MLDGDAVGARLSDHSFGEYAGQKSEKAIIPGKLGQ